MITIVDYGMGNLGSIKNMLKKIGQASIVTSSEEQISKAEKIILPGVGAFDRGIQNLNELNLIEILTEKAIKKKTPILGICLGMQLLAEKSEEGQKKGLGWIDAQIVKFKFEEEDKKYKIPHMGWNTVYIRQQKSLFDDMPADSRFYFVHSYHMQCNDPEDVLAETSYGYQFVSCVQRINIFGVQFHPEKSHKYGMKLLKNFTGI